jgi:hypothetical protein
VVTINLAAVRRIVSIALFCLLAGSLAPGCSESPPQLHFDSSVPSDLQQLATAVWTEFLDHHPARLGCIGDVTLRAAWELDTRGEYQPDTATVVVRVPGTPATLSDELVHEFAHNVEFTCPEHILLRPVFLEAQGFPADADWFSGASWATTPSEQYAEATVQYVLGERTQRQGIELTDDAIAAVRNWAEGSASS